MKYRIGIVGLFVLSCASAYAAFDEFYNLDKDGVSHTRTYMLYVLGAYLPLILAALIQIKRHFKKSTSG